MKAEETTDTHTHVVIFPCPVQGHVSTMLKLAQLLSLHRFHITFITTDCIHHRLHRFGDIQALLQTHPTLQFKTFPDGLPHNHPRSGESLVDLFHSINLHAKPHIKHIVLSAKPTLTCFIGDGVFGALTVDVANEVSIPIIHFRTISASCFWTYFCVPKLFQSNQLPIRGDEDMDRVITCIPGMENVFRCRDLPSFCRGTESDIVFPMNSMAFETRETLRARALILNTFEDLEGSVLSQIRLHFPRVFTIGPLHAQLNSRQDSNPETTPSTNCVWEVDRSCVTWLDSQPLKSVIYVSFGSIATVTREKLLEIWYGLVKSKKRFLWVVRHDMDGGDRVPAELEEGTKERGFIVGWAPQEEVLAHKAVGGFLTHSGWNSTLESLAAGVPMICWPAFGDQHVNSRFVSEVCKVGLDMKDVACDRDIVERMVNDLMGHRREEFLNSAEALALLANQSVSPAGSSYSHLDHLMHYIKSLGQDII
ncbi:7-deoxyloganetic acid glucosyltransferase [Cajanus cajan]|uniref:Glycosyltransferase n=1 Tax=Cajanus cajan TaxID=3821 RepID=A0A151TH18_CAJCA|nr:7-deoxyloganetic acid glucosyltransferase [Cajanus cajan]KYP66351.1 Cytokinin-O-glucosyltransferase 2 [Cajanus cajan]